MNRHFVSVKLKGEKNSDTVFMTECGFEYESI